LKTTGCPDRLLLMPRPLRAAEGGLVYHTLNRANAGITIFAQDADYVAFELVLAEAIQRQEMRLFAYCVMPTHFHLVVWPREDGDLSRFMGWLTLTHTQRWHAHHRTVGMGHLYQGRFKSFPVQPDEHFLTVCRYVERNPLRANLVSRAQDWRWTSLWSRAAKDAETRPALSAWPIERSRDWTARVNRPFVAAEEEAVQRSIRRGQPFGSEPWQLKTSERLGLDSTFRDRGRPRKRSPAVGETPSR
jgi:putative transposase